MPSNHQDTLNQSIHRRQARSRPRPDGYPQPHQQLLPSHQASRSGSQSHITGQTLRNDQSSRQDSKKVILLNRDASTFDDTDLMEVRIPTGHMGLSLLSTPNGLMIERKSSRSVATGLNHGDTLVALDGVDVSKFSPEVVTNLLKTRENQPCRSIVYHPGARHDSNF